MEQQIPRPCGVTQSQLQRMADLARHSVYEMPELNAPDIPHHLRNSPRWTDLLGQR